MVYIIANVEVQFCCGVYMASSATVVNAMNYVDQKCWKACVGVQMDEWHWNYELLLGAYT